VAVVAVGGVLQGILQGIFSLHSLANLSNQATQIEQVIWLN
jgi:hypothetical protein